VNGYALAAVIAICVACVALALSLGSVYYALKAAKYRRESEAIYRGTNRR